MRLGVLGGGCSGLELPVQVRAEAARRPTTCSTSTACRSSSTPRAWSILDGMTLDYKESLMQSGFVFENPNATEELRLRNFVLGLMTRSTIAGSAAGRRRVALLPFCNACSRPRRTTSRSSAWSASSTSIRTTCRSASTRSAACCIRTATPRAAPQRAAVLAGRHRHPQRRLPDAARPGRRAPNTC